MVFEMASTIGKVISKDFVNDGEIDLSMCDLQDVPIKEIVLVKKAYSLDLSNNHLCILPKTFSTLVHITKLDLSKNELKELPENFGDLVQLKYLDLYKNRLQHLPLSFGKLRALRWLDLKDNALVPAIANVAGPCSNGKQCRQCAREVVDFYSSIQLKIDEEIKTRREAHVIRDSHLNGQKRRQEKQNKKATTTNKKVQNKECVENIPVSPNGNVEENHSSTSATKGSSIFGSAFKVTAFLLLLLSLSVAFLFANGAARLERLHYMYYLRQFE